jgi:WD40 repeat protein
MNMSFQEYIIKSIIHSLDFLECKSLIYKLNNSSLFYILSKLEINVNIKQLHTIKAESTIRHPIIKPQNRISLLVVLTDNRLASCGVCDNTITIWDTKSKSKKILYGHELDVEMLFSLRDNNLFSCCRFYTMIVWHHISFNILYKIQTNGMVKHVLQNKVGQLVTAQYDGLIRIWDSFKEYNNVCDLFGGQTPIYAISLLNNNNIVSSSMDRVIRLYAFNKSSYNFVAEYQMNHCVWATMLIEDNTIAARSDRAIIILNSYTGFREIIPITVKNTSSFIVLQNKNIAVGCHDGSIVIIGQVKSLEYKIMFTFKKHNSAIRFFLIHKHHTLISASEDSIIMRDINRNFRVFIAIDLKLPHLDQMLLLENEIIFCKLNSLNKLIIN